MSVADLVDESVRIFLLEHGMVSGITDDGEIPSERIEKMHEIVDDVLGDFVESGFDYHCEFFGIGMFHKYFGFWFIIEREFEILFAYLSGHFIIIQFDFYVCIS